MAGYAARAAAARAQLQALVATALNELPSARRLAAVAAVVQADMRRQVALLCAPELPFVSLSLCLGVTTMPQPLVAHLHKQYRHLCASHRWLLLL